MTHILAAALVLHISNFSGAPPSIVHQAQEEVTRVYAEIGVPLEWSEPPDAASGSSLAIRIVLLPYETGDLRRSEQHGDGRRGADRRRQRRRLRVLPARPGGSRALRGVHRRWCSRARSRTSSDICCCRRARTRRPGLMRACWSRDEFHRAEQGQLRLSAGRRRADSRGAAVARGPAKAGHCRDSRWQAGSASRPKSVAGPRVPDLRSSG